MNTTPAVPCVERTDPQKAIGIASSVSVELRRERHRDRQVARGLGLRSELW